jgi:hypothetical protein
MRKSCPQMGQRTFEESFAGWHTCTGDLLSYFFTLQIQETAATNEFSAGIGVSDVGIS